MMQESLFKRDSMPSGAVMCMNSGTAILSYQLCGGAR